MILLIILVMCVDLIMLIEKFLIMKEMVVWELVILFGVWGVIFFSVIGSILGVFRVL